MNLVNEEVARQIAYLYYSAIPMSQREIAIQLGISHRSVSYYIDKHKKNEVSSLQSKRGRPSKKPLSIFFPLIGGETKFCNGRIYIQLVIIIIIICHRGKRSILFLDDIKHGSQKTNKTWAS